jgi:hypothetical protein
MSARLAALRGRIAALALLLALLAAIWAVVVRPVVAAYREAGEQIVHSQELLEKFRRLGGSRATLQARLDELRARAASQTAYLDAASDALAAASLQETVKRLVEAGGGKVLSTAALAALDDPPFRRIAIQVRMDVTTAQAQKVFYALDAADLLLLVDNLHIRGNQPRQRASGIEAETRLYVRLDLYGYMRADMAEESS